MENLYKNMGTILGFLVITFLIGLFGGEKMSSNILILILFSMLILNAEKLKKTLNNFKDSLNKKEEK